MVKNQEKSVGQKVAYGLAIAGVAVGLGCSAALHGVNKDMKDVKNVLEVNQASLLTLQEQVVTKDISIADFQKQVEALGINVADLQELTQADELIIADYEAEIEALELDVAMAQDTAVTSVVSDNAYMLEFENLGAPLAKELNDNHFDKLADYKVDVDGDDIRVEEFLSINTSLDREANVDMMFEDGDVIYTIEYDNETGAVIDSDNPLKINIFGEAVEIIDVAHDVLTLKTVDDAFAGEGDIINGVTIVKIGDESIIVSANGETKIVSNTKTKTVGGIEVNVKEIFTSDNAADSLVNLVVGEDLEKVYKVGDSDKKYYDADELFEFTSIEPGKIVITLTEDVENVAELVLPNDFAKISFALDDVDYQDVKVEKNDGIITKVYFELEDFDSTYAEWEGGAWVLEEEDDRDDSSFNISKLPLKDSDFFLRLGGIGNVAIEDATDVLVFVKPTEVSVGALTNVDGDSEFDNDLDYTSVEGIVVEPTEDFLEADADDKESIVIHVPEVAVKATLIVE